MRFSDASQKLIGKFIEEGRSEAFDLTKALLEITPDPKADVEVEDELFRPLLKPETRLSEREYTDFLDEIFPKLVALDADRAFTLACDLLRDYVRLLYPKNDGSSHEDVSQVWRPAIEEHEQNGPRDDIKNALVTTVRDTALGIVGKDHKALTKTLSMLDGYKWVVFTRLSMHLLSEHSTLVPELVAERLADPKLLNDGDFRHEYAVLAQKGFGLLNAKQQEAVLLLVEEAKSMAEAVKKSEVDGRLSPDQATGILESWRRDRLSHFKDYLAGSWKTRYEALVAKYGEPDHPDFSSYSTSYTGPNSSVNAQDLISMGTKDMLNLLKTWEPEKDQYGFGPSKEGLGRELAAAVRLDPKHFESIVESFKGLDPTYVRAYLDGFRSLAEHDTPIDWEKILMLAGWVVSQTRDIPGRKGGIMDQDPDWGWARRVVASLVERGVNTNAIPFDQRGAVWGIIEALTDDPNPSQSEELSSDGTPIDDAYSLSINTTRGEAMNAVIEYALWTYRNLEKAGAAPKDFSAMPEVKTVLEKHLDPAADPSIAVRAVYGRFFPWLLLMDSAWTTAHLDEIMPPGKFDDPLYRAAWQSYVIYTNGYDAPLPVLKERYREGVRNFGKVREGHRANQDERLIQHLMTYYCRGTLALTDELFVEFWSAAGPKLRQYALDHLGHVLNSDGITLPPEVIARLKALWEQRLVAAQAAKDKAVHAGEMIAFGWWFSSGQFDTLWSCQQYLAALEIGGPKTDSDYFVSRRLAVVVKTFPVEAIKILKKLVLGDRQTWLMYRSDDEIRSIILAAQQSVEKEAQAEAKDLINRLVANGHLEFRDMLVLPPAGSP